MEVADELEPQLPDPRRRFAADGSVPSTSPCSQDERHLRRKVITLVHGDRVLVDLPEPLVLEDRDVLVLEDGRHAEIIAADEELLEIRGRDAVHLASLAWHIGNRHLAAAIEAERILILRDHVIKSMLEGLGAMVSEVVEPFNPLRGAYSGDRPWPRGHGHSHVMATTTIMGMTATTTVIASTGPHAHGHAHESTGIDD